MRISPLIKDLVTHGIKVELVKFPDKNNLGVNEDLAWAVSGFYRHGSVYLTEIDGTDCYAVNSKRSGKLDEVVTLEDMARLNHAEWEVFRKPQYGGYSISDMWLPLLLEFGLVKPVTTITYESCRD